MSAKTTSALRMLLLSCAVLPGCREQPVPPVIPSTPPLRGDEKALRALDYYEPSYQVDENGRVIRLRMTTRHIPPAAMAEIGKLTELIKIDFYGAKISDEGLGQLKDLSKLRALGLGATPITDKGLVHLEKLPKLQWLWVSKKTITAEGVEKLNETRPELNVYWQ